MTRHNGFTLVELLVVVAIIIALLAILMPSMNRAVAVAEDVKCKAQQRQLGQALLSLLSDSFGQLPAVWHENGYDGPEPYQKQWIGKEVFDEPGWGSTYHGGDWGALRTYFNDADESIRELVRCPSLPDGTVGSGVDSNGLFDTVMIQAMAGARVTTVPSTTELRNIDNGKYETIPSRIFTEEDPANALNALYRDPGHKSTNRMGNWHFDNGGNYTAIDGSVHRLAFGDAPLGPRADYFWAATPSGNIIPVSPTTNSYGWWNTQ